MPTQPGCLDEFGCEPLDPPVHGHVIDSDVALGQQFLDVPVGQDVPQVSVDRHGDHLPRKPETSER
jgi:hypothetical protein